MRFTKSFFLLLIIATSPVSELAAEIYKTVDENGNVVFSDKKSTGAENVQVQPNVIDIDTPAMPESTAQEKPKQQASSQPQVIQQEVTVTGTSAGGNARRRVRTQTNGEGINNGRRPTATPAARQGVGR
jgi:hypothetical protein